MNRMQNRLEGAAGEKEIRAGGERQSRDEVDEHDLNVVVLLFVIIFVLDNVVKSPGHQTQNSHK